MFYIIHVMFNCFTWFVTELILLLYLVHFPSFSKNHQMQVLTLMRCFIVGECVLERSDPFPPGEFFFWVKPDPHLLHCLTLMDFISQHPCVQLSCGYLLSCFQCLTFFRCDLNCTVLLFKLSFTISFFFSKV